jgi:hypothetical protein
VSHWHRSSSDRASQDERREAPAVRSRARERVGRDSQQNRGLKGRHIEFDELITLSLPPPEDPGGIRQAFILAIGINYGFDTLMEVPSLSPSGS